MACTFDNLPTNWYQVPPHLATTNRVPTAEELAPIDECVKQVNYMLRNVQLEIHAKEEEILAKQTELSALHQKKKSLLEFARPYYNAKAPFRRLPEDVVLEIFSACVAGEANPEVKNYSAPLVLMKICRDFRRIASSTPTLWKAIHIDCSGIPPYNSDDHDDEHMEEFYCFEKWFTRRTKKVIRPWLARSNPLPLDISVGGFNSCQTSSNENMMNVLISLLVKYSRRWQNVTIDLPCYDNDFKSLNQLCGANIPLLRLLDLRCRFNSTLPFIFDAPKLTHLVLRDSYWPSFFRNFAVPSHLTHLTIEAGIEDIPFNIKFLRLFPLIVECYLWFDELLVDTPITENIHLQHLEILGFSQCLYSVIAYLEAPMLRSLEYECIVKNSDLIPFLGRSQRITYLAIEVASVSKLQEILRHCPSLETLQIHLRFTEPDSALFDSFLNDISRQRQQGGVLANLVNLEMENSAIIIEHIATLENLLSAMDSLPWKKVALMVEVNGMDYEDVLTDMAMYCDSGVLHLSPPCDSESDGWESGEGI